MKTTVNKPAVSFVLNAMKFAIKTHQDTNQTYDKHYPYSVHLAHVVSIGYRFFNTISVSVEEQAIIIAALWLHDSVEDARLTYNDLVKEVGNDVGDIVIAVTNYSRGKTRAARMPDFIYEDIKNTPHATYVKLCDRIANMEYSMNSGSNMFKNYCKEWDYFKAKLYREEYAALFQYGDDLVAHYELDLVNKN
jgi:(p)ppGpp synthase/HD superfamily hydrolase